MKPIYKCICDVCRSNEANQHFKVKKLSGVWTWKGHYVRAKQEDRLVVGIGNIIEDKWFEPREFFKGD